MRRRILSVGPTDIYLHMGTLLFAAYALLTGSWPMLLTATVSILLHECAHAAAAAIAGQPPRELELTPLGAVMRLEDEARLPLLRRLAMLAAGPLMTLLLCGIALRLTAAGHLSVPTGRMIFAANLALLLLNLLPALPLDGGRILSLVLSSFLPSAVVQRVIRTLGMVMGCAAIAGSIWLSWRFGGWNWSLAACGCFLCYSAWAATTTFAMAQLRQLMDRKIELERRGWFSCRERAILATQPLHRAVRLLTPRALTTFWIIEPGTMKPLATLDEPELIAVWLEHPEMNCIEAARREDTQ